MRIVTTLPRALLASLSQIYLVESRLAGLAILLALALASPQLAAGALLGIAVSIAVAALVAAVRSPGPQDPWARARSGLWGYNGALLGILGSTRCEPGWAWAGWIAAAAACASALYLLAERPAARRGLPLLTAPFCAVGTALLPALPPAASAPAPEGPALAGIPAGFSQVVLASGAGVGLLILAGLALASRPAAAWGAAGAAASLPLLLAVPAAEYAGGAWAYCPLLVALALGTAVPGARGVGAWRHRALPVLLGVTLAALMQAALQGLGWPVLTWPFVAATWVIVAVEVRRNVR
ncbi:urea transporter [Corynebacterium mastitidis]|uniref:urea transporter n=1 Tax=Corynebacterium mastitidis TaxID=161890 RepID=UPI00254EAD8F|nr:urea transporter [Corynebacterium mastitidis]MDK8450330.1 urea transporter [Corynebacterium mastitidis]